MRPPPIPIPKLIVRGLNNDLLSFCHSSVSFCRRFISRTCSANRLFLSRQRWRSSDFLFQQGAKFIDIIIINIFKNLLIKRDGAYLSSELELFVWRDVSASSLEDVVTLAFCSHVLFVIDVDFKSVDTSVWFSGSLGSGLSGGAPTSSVIKNHFFFFVY